MILLSVIMRFTQEYRSSRAAETLRTMVQTKATVKRKIVVKNQEDMLKPIQMVPFSIIS
jgi:P-type Mg2+ transporter